MIQSLNILVADNNFYMRRLTRTMLMNLGAKSAVKAADRTRGDPHLQPGRHIYGSGHAGTQRQGGDAYHALAGVFPRPNLPIIMLTNRGQPSTVIGA
jgi:two-component system chemotaxis response regulator CheY